MGAVEGGNAIFGRQGAFLAWFGGFVFGPRITRMAPAAAGKLRAGREKVGVREGGGGKVLKGWGLWNGGNSKVIENRPETDIKATINRHGTDHKRAWF